MHIRPLAVALLSYIVLDGLWLGVFMSGFYRSGLGPLARLAPDGSLAPLWLVAAPVYLLLAFGQVWFVMPRAAGAGLLEAAFWGAALGLVIYGVYDLTNWSTLRGYGATLAVVDIAWGMCASAAAAMAVAAFGRS
jgi:uncharacterized membrane protein